VGWPLIRVPDPKGCHSNWVEHYWEDFGGYLDKFTDGNDNRFNGKRIPGVPENVVSVEIDYQSVLGVAFVDVLNFEAREWALQELGWECARASSEYKSRPPRWK
jgi:hypothetical protein